MLLNLARRTLSRHFHSVSRPKQELYIDTSTRYTQLEFHKRLDRIQAALPSITSQ